MHTKNAKTLTDAERMHIASVKALACSVCDQPGPSDAHHVKQGQHFTVIALCKDCHQGSFAGLHGQRRAWIGRKMEPIDALAVTIKRLSTAFNLQGA